MPGLLAQCTSKQPPGSHNYRHVATNGGPVSANTEAVYETFQVSSVQEKADWSLP